MTPDFAALLRRLRMEAGLSQESLAELAGISVNAIGIYERGLQHVPRRETIALLAKALQLGGEPQEEFERAAARRRVPVPLAPSAAAHNLPRQGTSFIGRRSEVESITGLLAARRLVTITGAGGIGKTRIALEVASRIEQFPNDGIWFVDLAPVGDGDFVLGKLASVLDLRLPEQDELHTALAAAIKDRELFLILDNCEHRIPIVRKVAVAILSMCPQITLLATSRERIGIAGELSYPLPTLPIPSERVTTAAEGRAYAALDLFAERAETAKHGFTFSDKHVEAATDICRRLDGIALAIELAAARLPVLGIAGLRTQLTKHFRVIDGSRHDLPARQQTLHATLSWSYDLLDEPERILFRRLATFASGWTLEAAEAVCADDALERSSVLDALFSLVEKSLVIVDLDAAAPRYSFFESTRAYASEKLAADTEGPELARRHGEWTAASVDRAYELVGIIPRRDWEIVVLPELGNALAALEWALSPVGNPVVAGRIASGLRGLWEITGLSMLGRRFVDTSLERISPQEHPELVARLLFAQERYLHGGEVVDAMNRAISLLHHTGNRRELARCYAILSYSLAQTGEYSEAEEASQEASSLYHAAGLQRTPVYSGLLINRSGLFLLQGRFDEARETLTEALSISSKLNDDWSISRSQIMFAEMEFMTGNTERAVEIGREALASARKVRRASQELATLCNLASYHLVLFQIDDAESNAREALGLSRTSSFYIHIAIQHFAAVAALRGNPSKAARFLGYVDAWYERTGCLREPTEQKSYDILMESLRKQLSHDEISALAARGALLTEDAAVDEAITSSSRT